jgi:hypothetical protein
MIRIVSGGKHIAVWLLVIFMLFLTDTWMPSVDASHQPTDSLLHVPARDLPAIPRHCRLPSHPRSPRRDPPASLQRNPRVDPPVIALVALPRIPRPYPVPTLLQCRRRDPLDSLRRSRQLVLPGDRLDSQLLSRVHTLRDVLLLEVVVIRQIGSIARLANSSSPD